jgi:hypothetical protein
LRFHQTLQPKFRSLFCKLQFCLRQKVLSLSLSAFSSLLTRLFSILFVSFLLIGCGGGGGSGGDGGDGSGNGGSGGDGGGNGGSATNNAEQGVLEARLLTATLSDITQENAKTITHNLIAINRAYGAWSLPSAASGSSVLSLNERDQEPLSAVQTGAVILAATNCLVGGSYEQTSIREVYKDCDNGAGYKLNGIVDKVTVRANPHENHLRTFATYDYFDLSYSYSNGANDTVRGRNYISCYCEDDVGYRNCNARRRAAGSPCSPADISIGYTVTANNNGSIKKYAFMPDTSRIGYTTEGQSFAFGVSNLPLANNCDAFSIWGANSKSLQFESGWNLSLYSDSSLEGVIFADKTCQEFYEWLEL